MLATARPSCYLTQWIVYQISFTMRVDVRLLFLFNRWRPSFRHLHHRRGCGDCSPAVGDHHMCDTGHISIINDQTCSRTTNILIVCRRIQQATQSPRADTPQQRFPRQQIWRTSSASGSFSQQSQLLLRSLHAVLIISFDAEKNE